MNVVDLIDSRTTRQKIDVIDNLFIPHEAKLIKSIPLSVTLPADKMVWAETANGNFTVVNQLLVCLHLQPMELLLMVVY